MWLRKCLSVVTICFLLSLFGAPAFAQTVKACAQVCTEVCATVSKIVVEVNPLAFPANPCLPSCRCKCQRANGSGVQFINAADQCPGGARVFFCGEFRCSTVAPTVDGFDIGAAMCTRCDRGCAEGAPTYPMNGQKGGRYVDFRTGGTWPLEVVRHYTSANLFIGAPPLLGRGWFFDFEYTLGVIDANNVMVGYPDQSIYKMVKQSDGTYQSTQVKLDLLLTRTAGPPEVYELRLPDDRTVRFETVSGLFRPVGIKHRGGYEQSLVYDSTGQLTQISDNLGRALTFTWAAGQLTRIDAPGSVQIDYT